MKNDIKITRKLIGSVFVAEIEVVLAFDATGKIQGETYNFEKGKPLTIVVQKDSNKLGSKAKKELDMAVMDIEREVYTLKWETNEKKSSRKNKTEVKEEDLQKELEDKE